MAILIAYLLGLVTAISSRSQIKPVNPQTKEVNSNQNTSKAQEKASPVLTSKLGVPESISNQQHTDSKRKSKVPNWLKFFVNVLTLLAVIWYACEARKQRIAMDGTYEEVKKQATTANKQLVLSLRPWVGLTDNHDPIQSTPIMFDKDGNASVRYQVSVKNFSGGAAQNVISVAELLVTEDPEAIESAQKEMCSENYVGHPQRDLGLTLYPGKAEAWGELGSFFRREQMISKSYTGGVEGWLVGCIGYRDQFLNLYHYGFVFWYLLDGTVDGHEFKVTPRGRILGKFVPKFASLDYPPTLDCPSDQPCHGKQK